MIRAFLFAAVFLILSSARITIPIKQHQLPATGILIFWGFS